MKKQNYYNFFSLYIKKVTYYQRNKESILNRVKDYYHDNIERLKKEQKSNIENYLKKKKI